MSESIVEEKKTRTRRPRTATRAAGTRAKAQASVAEAEAKQAAPGAGEGRSAGRAAQTAHAEADGAMTRVRVRRHTRPAHEQADREERAEERGREPHEAERREEHNGREARNEHSDHEGRREDRYEREDRREERHDERRHHRNERYERDERSNNNGRGDRERRGGYNNRGRNNYNNYGHNNRHQRNNNRRQAVPQVSVDELSKLKVAELREKAEGLELDVKGLKKAELVQAVYKAEMEREGFVHVTGYLDVLSDGYGFLRTQGYLPSEHDVYVSAATIRRLGLRKGDKLEGQTRPARPTDKYAALAEVAKVNDKDPELARGRKRFRDLTPIFPDERLVMEHGRRYLTARVIDLTAPIGKGQRGLIVSPPKAGKTTVLKDIAASITANNPEVHLMCLLVDERPEEVTDMERSIKGEVIASTFDMPSDNHIAAAEMVIERAKRLVEDGEDVVILLDSITRLARAYNLAQPASGRVLSGGVDSAALYPPKRFLGAARNIENGGSLSILASALVDTGSKMDEVIFEEFKGTGNMELKLDRNLADRRIFPAIDPVASGTRREDLLMDPQVAPLIWGVRRILAGMNNTERAMSMLIKSLQKTEDNAEFLMRTAKRAQEQSGRYDEKFEL